MSHVSVVCALVLLGSIFQQMTHLFNYVFVEEQLNKFWYFSRDTKKVYRQGWIDR